MLVFLAFSLLAFSVPEDSSSASEWLAEGQRLLAEAKPAEALDAIRRAAEMGLPAQVVVVSEVQALVALDRQSEAVGRLAGIPAPAPGVIAGLRSTESLTSFLQREDVAAQMERLRPCSGASHREFDFWVGNWRVTDRTGERLLGTNRISRQHGGCVILEKWTSAAGTTGSSFNIFDERSKKWHQFWVDGSGTNWLSWDEEGNPATIRGGLVDGEMIMTAAPGTTPMARGRWKLMEDGRVRQIFESSTDGGSTWTINFEG